MQLTAFQNKVLALLTTGITNKEIAHKLNSTTTAIDQTSKLVYRKLKVKNRVQAAVFYVRAELLDDGISIIETSVRTRNHD